MTTAAQTPSPDEGRFGAAQIVEHVLDHYTIGKSTDGMLFAVPTASDAPRVAREIRSLRAEISRSLWRDRAVAVGREAVSAAIETLCGLADEARTSRLYLRAAEVGAAVYLDLADRSGRFIEVSRYGWEVRSPGDGADGVHPIFRRTAASNPLPAPERGGSRDELRVLLGFDEQDPRWVLIWGWLVASLFESVPRPILWALGPQGSGKSTRARMALSVVDPTDALGREPGKNERDDTTAAAGRYLPSWDNIGGVSAATSDWLCRLVTGVEIGRRALYTDDDLRVSTLRRSGVATSIVLPFGLGPDALERLVLVEFDRVAEADRRPERALWEEFHAAHPRILGALLDDVAGVLANLAEVRETARDLPRMADYALLLHALDAHLDLDPWEGFAEAYVRNVRGVLADRATADPLTAALLDVVKSSGGRWEGAPQSLLTRIEKARQQQDPRAPWPTSGSSLSAALTRNQETLRAAGLIAGKRKTNGKRLLFLEAVPVDPNLDDDEAASDDDDAEDSLRPRLLSSTG